MFFGDIEDRASFDYLPAALQECLAYACRNDLSTFENGRHDIKGDQIYVNIMEYDTTQRENRFWEAHKQYLDLHMVLSGEETIDLNSVRWMEQKEYVPAEDFLPLVGAQRISVNMGPGDFLVCWPEDAHRTAIAVNGPAHIKKAVFKIKI